MYKLIVLFSLASVAFSADHPATSTRDFSAQVAERIVMLQKEFELLIRQFNRIRTGNALRVAQDQILPETITDPIKPLFEIAHNLEATRQQLDALLLETQRKGRQAPDLPTGGLPGLGQVTSIFSGIMGQGAGLGQFMGIFNQLATQLSSLTRVISGLTGGLGGFVRGNNENGGGANPFAGLTGAGNPLEQIASTLTGLTTSLAGMLNVFRAG